MKLLGLHLHNVGALASASLDLTSIRPGLVALCGPNGAGKSTTLEAIPCALGYGLPTRSTLKELARSKDAYVEATVMNGRQYTIRRHLGEVLVTDAEGRPAIEKAGPKAFGAWAKRHLPAEEVFFATEFAAQGSGGMADLSTAERKAVILRVIGSEKFEAWATAARAALKDAKAEATNARGGLALVEERLSDIEGRVRAINIAGSPAEHLENMRKELADLDQERARAIAAESDRKRRDEALAAQQRAAAHVEAIALELDGPEGIRVRIRNNERILAMRETIEAAVKRLAEIDAGAMQEASEAVDKASALLQDASSAEAEARADATRLSSGARSLAEQLHEAQSLTEQEADVRAAQVALDALKLDDLQAEEATATRELEALQAERGLSAEGRIEKLREALTAITRAPSDFTSIARDALIVDDEAVQRAADLPSRLVHAMGAMGAARINLATARAEAARLQALAATLPLVEQAKARATALVAEQEAKAGEAIEARKRLERAAEDREAAAAALETAKVARAALEAERARLSIDARMGGKLEAADGALRERQAEETRKVAELEQARAELAAIVVPVLPEVRDLDVLDGEAATARRAIERAAAAVRELEGLETARSAASEEREVSAKSVAACEAEVADWAILADALGSTGIPALLIDAFGPELSELTNDLLHHAFGPRFSVRFDTTRASADGKKLIEDLEISVLDTEARCGDLVESREGPIDSFSGGEKVILCEAVSLALTLLACRIHGVSGVTLVRDESGAALSEERAEQYVRMLQRVREQVSAEHILLVSHNATVNALADTRVNVVDGRLEVAA